MIRDIWQFKPFIFSGKCIIPIPAVLPLILSPLPRIYRGYRGFPDVPIPMQLSTANR